MLSIHQKIIISTKIWSSATLFNINRYQKCFKSSH